MNQQFSTNPKMNILVSTRHYNINRLLININVSSAYYIQRVYRACSLSTHCDFQSQVESIFL